MPFVFDFDHTHPRPPMELKDLLGGKGANLAEMTSVLELPVPPGFTISTDACRAYMAGGWPKGLDAEVASARARLEKAMGKAIGDAKDPLLVSVRSGAKFSMPGMMDTVLNLGLNDKSVEGLAAQTGDERFAFDSYRRFIAMYGRIVLELPGEEFDSLFDAAKELAGTTSDAQGAGRAAALPGRLLPADRRAPHRQALPPEPDRPAARRHRGRLPQLERAAGHRLPRPRAHRARPGHRGQRAGHGLRQPRRQLGHRRRLHPRPGHGRQGRLRRLPGQRPGRGRGGRHPQHRADLGAEEAVPQGPRRAAQDLRPARVALLGHVRHRVHHRAGQALDAPDPRRQAHRRRRPEDGGRHGAGQATSASPRPRRSPASPRTTSTRCSTPSSPARATRCGPRASGPARAPPSGRSTSAPTTPRRQPSGASRSSWCATRPRPRTCTACWPPRASSPPGAAWSATPPSWPAGWGKPAVVGAEVLRLGDRTVSAGGVTLAEGDWVSLDGGAGIVVVGQVPLTAAKPPAAFETVLSWADEIRKGHLAVRTNADTGDDAANARKLGRRGHRPVPHRAHVPGRGPPARGAPHDPGPDARRGDRRPRGAAPGPEGGLHGHPRRHGRPARHGAPARPAPPRVPALDRGAGHQGGHRRAQRRGAPPLRGRALVEGSQPDARDPRRAPRRHQARSLRHAGAGPHGGGPPAGGRRRAPHRRDHDPPDREPGRAGPGPGLGRGRRGRREQGAGAAAVEGSQGGHAPRRASSR